MQYGKEYGYGTEQYLSLLATELKNQGDEVLFLSGDPDHHYTSSSLFHPVESNPFPIYSTPTQGILAVTGHPVSTYVDFLKAHQPDLLHLANPAHIGINIVHAARMLTIPVVVTIMDYWWICPKHILLTDDQQICDANVCWRTCVGCQFHQTQKRYYKIIEKIIGIRSIFHLFFVSFIGRKQNFSYREIIQWLRRKTIIIPLLNQSQAIIFPSQTSESLLFPYVKNPVSYRIPYGVDPIYFTAREAKVQSPVRSTNQLQSEITLGYAGSLAFHKGLHLVLQAIRRLDWKNMKLLIAGEGSNEPYKKQLNELSNGLNVHFIGKCSREQMSSFYNQIDLLVLPSLWPENTPFVLLEALAKHIPVLGSHAPGIAEIISDPNFLFDVNSVESLADKFHSYMQQRHHYQFPCISSSMEMAVRTREVYERVLRKRNLS